MIPPSTARRTIGSASDSSSAHSLLSCLPKLIIPRHTRETHRPVPPRFTYSISSPWVAGAAPYWQAGLADLERRPDPAAAARAPGGAERARVRRRRSRGACHHLARRPHLRSAAGCTGEAVARKHCLLRPGARRLDPFREIQRGERLAEQEPARVLDQRDSGRLGDERYGARRARVRLQHEEPLAVERELQVEQAARAQAAGKRSGDRADLFAEAIVDARRGNDDR